MPADRSQRGGTLRWRSGSGLVRDADRRGTLSCKPSTLATFGTDTYSLSTQRYNPELQRKSLENRKGKQEDFDNFVTNLKSYSKSDKPGTLCHLRLCHAWLFSLLQCTDITQSGLSGSKQRRGDDKKACKLSSTAERLRMRRLRQESRR